LADVGFFALFLVAGAEAFAVGFTAATVISAGVASRFAVGLLRSFIAPAARAFVELVRTLAVA